MSRYENLELQTPIVTLPFWKAVEQYLGLAALSSDFVMTSKVRGRHCVQWAWWRPTELKQGNATTKPAALFSVGMPEKWEAAWKMQRRSVLLLLQVVSSTGRKHKGDIKSRWIVTGFLLTSVCRPLQKAYMWECRQATSTRFEDLKVGGWIHHHLQSAVSLNNTRRKYTESLQNIWMDLKCESNFSRCMRWRSRQGSCGGEVEISKACDIAQFRGVQKKYQVLNPFF